MGQIERYDTMSKQRYVVEGNIHFGEKLIFVETEQDEKGNPLGTFLNELLEMNVKENSKVTIVIDVE